jgi:imidazoleglycerol-phosphate dehydratase
MADRQARVERKTKETDITLTLNLDQTAPLSVQTGVPFFDHMLEAFACHGRFSLQITATGDIQVDPHHLMEDTGIVLGRALRDCLGAGYTGIERAASFSFPMDGTLTTVALDLCGRPTLVWHMEFGCFPIGNLDPNLFRDFFKGLADSAGAALHVHTVCQDNDHHLIESAMKGFGRALRKAVKRLDSEGALSTKGVIDV